MELNEHHVRVRAYYIWENDGCAFGRADAHWLQAEAELGSAIQAEPAAKPAKAVKAAASAKIGPKPKAAAKKVAAKDVAAKAKRSSREPARGAPLH